MNISRHHLTKAWRAFLLGGLFLGVAGLAQAQGRGWQADEVAGRLVDVAVLDADYQQPLPIYRHAGRHYVAGTPGQPYRILITNKTGARVMAVVSVDGINVLNGANASPNQTGYVLEPYQSATIDGWRKSLQHVARFEFAGVRNSYAGQTGRGNQVGVIGVAVFQERYRRPMPYPAPAPTMKSGDAAREMAGAPQAQRSLGTGHGQSEWSPVDTTTFTRATSYPVETLRLDCDSWEALQRKGIVPYRPGRPGEPNPFPGQFVPDPPRRW